MKSRVFIRPIDKDLKKGVQECFDQFKIFESIKGNVFLKINCTMPNTSAMTNVDLIMAAIELIKENCSDYNTIYVCDNGAVGTFTRMAFLVDKLAKRVKRAGAKPLYLDEKKSVDFDFKGKILNKPVPIPKIIYENLIENRADNTLINVPKLKSHTQARATICIKNFHGMLYDTEKMFMHHKIHQKIVDIVNVFRPDFNLVDAITVCDYGPIAFVPDWHKPMGLIMGGIDPVAVDYIGCKLIGIDPDGVKYIKLAAKANIGCNDYDNIDVIPSKDIIDEYKIQLHYENIPIELDPNIVMLKGSEKCCIEGCGGLGQYFQQLVAGKKVKPVISVMGKGHPEEHIRQLDEFSGPFIVAGPCAVNELKEYFENRVDRKKIKVFYLNEHMDISGLTKAVLKACNVSMFTLGDKFPFSIPRALLSYINALLHGVRCKFL
jgi:uncharacterized protein (DUF362 family)